MRGHLRASGAGVVRLGNSGERQLWCLLSRFHAARCLSPPPWLFRMLTHTGLWAPDLYPRICHQTDSTDLQETNALRARQVRQGGPILPAPARPGRAVVDAVAGRAASAGLLAAEEGAGGGHAHRAPRGADPHKIIPRVRAGIIALGGMIPPEPSSCHARAACRTLGPAKCSPLHMSCAAGSYSLKCYLLIWSPHQV